MTKEQIDQLWKLVEHLPNCRTMMVSPFEAECDCCDVVLMNIFDAGVAAEREACAKVCDGREREPLDDEAPLVWIRAASAIRERSNAIELTGSSQAASPTTGGSDVE